LVRRSMSETRWKEKKLLRTIHLMQA